MRDINKKKSVMLLQAPLRKQDVKTNKRKNDTRFKIFLKARTS